MEDPNVNVTTSAAVDTVGDAARSKVAMNKRLGLFSNSMIMAGFVIVISSLLVGGIIGAAFPPNLAIPIIIFAALSNSFVAILIGSIGTRTGYSCALIYRFSYGRVGTILPNLIMAFTGMGWFAVIVNTARDAVAAQFGVNAGTVLFFVIMILISILFVAPAFKSIKWIGYVNYVAVPALLIIIVYVTVKVIGQTGGLAGMMAITAVPTMPVLMGYSIAAGGWLQGATVSPDFTRFCKSGKQTAWAMAFSFGLLVFIQFTGAAFGAAVTGEWNIFTMLTTLGAGFIAFLAVFLGAWSTGQGIIYGASLQCSAPPTKVVKNQEYTRRMWLVILWALALVGGLLGIETIVNWWLGILSCVIAPIAITVILDYYAFPERQKMYESGAQPDMKVNPAAIVSYIVGFVVAYISNTVGFFIPIINGMIVTAVIYYVWMRIALNKGSNPEALMFKKRA